MGGQPGFQNTGQIQGGQGGYPSQFNAGSMQSRVQPQFGGTAAPSMAPRPSSAGAYAAPTGNMAGVHGQPDQGGSYAGNAQTGGWQTQPTPGQTSWQQSQPAAPGDFFSQIISALGPQLGQLMPQFMGMVPQMRQAAGLPQTSPGGYGGTYSPGYAVTPQQPHYTAPGVASAPGPTDGGFSGTGPGGQWHQMGNGLRFNERVGRYQQIGPNGQMSVITPAQLKQMGLDRSWGYQAPIKDSIGSSSSVGGGYGSSVGSSYSV
jgi:hypothetical protein